MAQSKSASLISPDPRRRGRPTESSPLIPSNPQPRSGHSVDTDQDGRHNFASRWLRGGLRGYLCCIPKKKKKSPTTESSANIGSILAKAPLDTVAATPLKGGWAEGVFSSELLKKSVVPRNITAAGTGETITPPEDVGKPTPLRTGTYRGTKLALTQMTKRIETR